MPSPRARSQCGRSATCEQLTNSHFGRHATMTVDPAALASAPVGVASERFIPTGQFRGTLDEFDYVEEEWFASGKAEGHPYTTSLTVRRPRDPSQFSGVVIVEPVHAASAAPVWIYTSTYQMRSGHGWAAVCSQKSVLDGFVKPANPVRYAGLRSGPTRPLQSRRGSTRSACPQIGPGLRQGSSRCGASTSSRLRSWRRSGRR